MILWNWERKINFRFSNYLTRKQLEFRQITGRHQNPQLNLSKTGDPTLLLPIILTNSDGFDRRWKLDFSFPVWDILTGVRCIILFSDTELILGQKMVL
jgi:hypothetical protein